MLFWYAITQTKLNTFLASTNDYKAYYYHQALLYLYNTNKKIYF